MTIALRGMTWNHPRGYDPMVATSAAFAAMHPDVTITWDARSLQDFEHFPVEVLADQYDLIVIDHPHIGQLADAGILLPFGGHDAGALQEMEVQSVGPSYASYSWQGQQWALPIDAAAQVQAWRPDLLGCPVKHWDDVMVLAKQGEVLWPSRSPHELMSFMTLAANAGTPCSVTPGPLLDVADSVAVLERLCELEAFVPPECRTMDPIAALEQLARDDRRALVPLVYGYVSYAQDGCRRHLVRFANIPSQDGCRPAGSTIGGTGLAISAKCRHPDVARAYALYVASEAVQCGLYAAAGGQPGHRAAWLDAEVNRKAHGFYRDTLATLDAVWLRPRHDGYVGFQAEGAALVAACLNGEASCRVTAERLNDAFARSFSRGQTSRSA